jgi:hypothetical protein
MICHLFFTLLFSIDLSLMPSEESFGGWSMSVCSTFVNLVCYLGMLPVSGVDVRRYEACHLQSYRFIYGALTLVIICSPTSLACVQT